MESARKTQDRSLLGARKAAGDLEAFPCTPRSHRTQYAHDRMSNIRLFCVELANSIVIECKCHRDPVRRGPSIGAGHVHNYAGVQVRRCARNRWLLLLPSQYGSLNRTVPHWRPVGAFHGAEFGAWWIADAVVELTVAEVAPHMLLRMRVDR
jgi:hypothetical protein